MRVAILTVAWLAFGGSAFAAQPDTAAPGGAAQSQTGKVARNVPLGRLFFTPAERAQLDIARTQKKAPAPTTVAEPEQPPPAPQIVSYGGIVRRSDGKSMLWINNRLVEEKEALAGLNLKGKVRPDGSVTLQVPESGGSIDVKVGQSVELQSGRLAEGRRGQPEAKSPVEDTQPGAGAGKPDGASSKAPASESIEKKADSAAAGGLRMELGSRASQSAAERPTGSAAR